MNMKYVRGLPSQTTIMPALSILSESKTIMGIAESSRPETKFQSLPLFNSPSSSRRRRARQAGKGTRPVLARREQGAPPDGPLVPELRPVPLPEADALLQLRVGTGRHVAGTLGLDGAQLYLQVPELRLVLCDRLFELVDAGLLLPQSLICSFLSLDRYCV